METIYDNIIISKKLQRKIYREHLKRKFLNKHNTIEEVLDNKTKKLFVDKAWYKIRELRASSNGWCNTAIQTNYIFLVLDTLYACYKNRNKLTNRNLNYYQSLVEVISHETIHLVIFEQEGKSATSAYDNIAPGLRENNGVFA